MNKPKDIYWVKDNDKRIVPICPELQILLLEEKVTKNGHSGAGNKFDNTPVVLVK